MYVENQLHNRQNSYYLVMIFYILVGMMLGVNAQPTLQELGQKFDTLEGNVESLIKEISNIKNQLEYGGKNFQTVSFSKWLVLVIAKAIHISW